MTKEDILKQYPDIDINESGGTDTFQPDAPIVERDPIAVIIEHPTQKQYLIARWSNGWCGFLTGGIEEGDTLEDTVRKELLEETGFKSIAHIEPMNFVSHGLFFHIVKKVNRLAHYHLVFAKLADLEQEPVSEEEQAIATFVWVPKDEIEGILTREDMKKLWRFYLGSEK